MVNGPGGGTDFGDQIGNAEAPAGVTSALLGLYGLYGLDALDRGLGLPSVQAVVGGRFEESLPGAAPNGAGFGAIGCACVPPGPCRPLRVASLSASLMSYRPPKLCCRRQRVPA